MISGVAVITSIYGGHDHLSAQPAQSVGAQWVAVTDGQFPAGPRPIGTDGPKVWEVVVEPRPAVSDRLAAKFAKCLPWNYTDAKTVIWIDGAYQFKDENSLRKLIEWADGYPIAQFKHYSRDCIYAEGEISAKLPKYSFQPVKAQMDHYRRLGHPEHYGLFAGGVIVRNFTDMPKMLREFGYRWLEEQIRWTDQDQLSEMAILRELGLVPKELPGELLDNEALGWVGHIKGEHR